MYKDANAMLLALILEALEGERPAGWTDADRIEQAVKMLKNQTQRPQKGL